jgi:hypothetical protein
MTDQASLEQVEIMVRKAPELGWKTRPLAECVVILNKWYPQEFDVAAALREGETLHTYWSAYRLKKEEGPND